MEVNKEKHMGLSSVQIIVFGFILLILMGAALLWLPISSADGEFTSPADALFTATTSVCVTGMTTVVTATHWSLFGKIVIFVLIQLGGLGVVCAGIGLMLLTKKKITMKERLLIQTAYNLDNIDGMVRLIRNVTYGAFMAEGMGAVLYSFVFIPEHGLAKGLWYSVFHSVSAFCNAGMDILGDSSIILYRDNIIINITTMLLVIMGGIGFIVWWDIKDAALKCIRLRKFRGQMFEGLSVHSKLAIVTTFICITAGAMVFFIAEYNNPDTLGNLSMGQKVMSSVFESVTTRTAGFITIPQENFRSISYLTILILMLIGGSPMSTAGGLKTTTLAMIFLTVKATVTGRKDTEVYGRKISNENIRNAIAVLSIVFLISMTAIFLLVAIEPFGIKDITFEVIAAMGTAGLTRGVTNDLSAVGKFIICLVMYAGRIGPITLVMAFNIRRKKHNMVNMRELAETKILIG